MLPIENKKKKSIRKKKRFIWCLKMRIKMFYKVGKILAKGSFKRIFTAKSAIKIFLCLKLIINDKKFFIGHGDGLGPGDYGYKFIKSVFGFKPFQWLFARLHPNFALGIMRFFSGRSRDAHSNFETETRFHGPDKERLLVFSEAESHKQDIDYFIFGHRHLPIDWRLRNNKSRYIGLGEWFFATTYAVFDGNDVTLKVFDNPNVVIFKNESKVVHINK